MSSETTTPTGDLQPKDREAFEYLVEHCDDPVVTRVSEAFLQSSADDEGDNEEANS